jgi:hypothetical protein
MTLQADASMFCKGSSANTIATTYQEKVVVLGLSAQVLEDSLLPEPFHQIPILNDTVANRIVHAVRF